MRESLRHHAARRHLLEPIVADRGGGAQSFLDVACLEFDLALCRSSRLRR
jgi:hypothetical protein